MFSYSPNYAKSLYKLNKSNDLIICSKLSGMIICVFCDTDINAKIAEHWIVKMLIRFSKEGWSHDLLTWLWIYSTSLQFGWFYLNRLLFHSWLQFQIRRLRYFSSFTFLTPQRWIQHHLQAGSDLPLAFFHFSNSVLSSHSYLPSINYPETRLPL